jgi:tRNA threonylcarbamoyladenosine biosynthesis protein TsaE
MTKYINYSIEEIGRTARMILSLNPSAKIFIFNGEMGSGKTTIIKAIIKELGYKGTVSSPTFSLIFEYLNLENT